MSDKIALTIDVTPEEHQRIIERAHENGFDTPSEYVLALVEEDLEEDSHESIVESFKQGWREAMSGNTIPASKLWEALQDD